MKSKELADKVFERMKSFDPNEIMPKLKLANEGAIQDYLNDKTCANYQFMTCLVDIVKPSQIVELGGAMGVGTICLYHHLPENSHLYSITLPEGGLQFSYIQQPIPKNMYLVEGDDLKLSNWPKDCYLSRTDLWYFDSLHTFAHLKAELELYSKYFKKGVILMFDDIRMNELWPIWRDLPYDKVELTKPLHYSGWGLATV